MFGGRSGEHEVSLMSANSILQAIDRQKFAVTRIGITKQGEWLTGDEAAALLAGKRFTRKPKSLLPTAAALAVDVIFPVLHGTFGEDGTIQGLLDIAGVPYVGSGVLGSAVGMDKDVMKRLFLAGDLPSKFSYCGYSSNLEHPRTLVRNVEEGGRYPLFVKPANLGSSVGISKVHNRAELLPAIRLAAKHDLKFIVEESASRQGVKTREFEVGVLANHPGYRDVSVVGEIIPGKEFYDYEDKYLADGAVAVIPAKIPAKLEKAIRDYAIMAFAYCGLSGLARVDFLFDPESQSLYLNEVNTMPGFTKISMYPKLWQAAGMSYPSLITRLIELAMERAQERATLSFSRE